MPVVEYCDNIHCRYNRERSCTSTDIEFDENGICSTATYDESPRGKKPGSGSQDGSGPDTIGQEGDEITDNERPTYGKDKEWIKYI